MHKKLIDKAYKCKKNVRKKINLINYWILNIFMFDWLLSVSDFNIREVQESKILILGAKEISQILRMKK